MSVSLPSPYLLTVHHVGGREGGCPFHLPDVLEADSPIVYYEADPDAVSGMGVGEGRPTFAFSKCVGRTKERRAFNITKKPHASSLLRFNEKYGHAYFHKANEEPILGVTFKVVNTIELETESLDSIVKSVADKVSPPDVLTLDTEGTELDILEGAPDLLEKEVLCVVSEVSFLPVREGQKLYGDVASFLLAKRFIPVQIKQHTRELALYRAPVGLRCNGIQLFADAAFLKDPEAICLSWSGQAAAIKLRKAAIAGLAFGQLEYALDCLTRARSFDVPSPLSEPHYWTFLTALEDCASKVAPRFMRIPGEEKTSSPTPTINSEGRSTPKGPNNRCLQSTIQKMIARNSMVRRLLSDVISLTKTLRRTVEAFLKLKFGRKAPVEKLLQAYGFAELSERVRTLRIRQTAWIDN